MRFLTLLSLCVVGLNGHQAIQAVDLEKPWQVVTPTIAGKPANQLRRAWVQGRLTSHEGNLDCALILGGSVGFGVLRIDLLPAGGSAKMAEKGIPQFHWKAFRHPDEGNSSTDFFQIEVIGSGVHVLERLNGPLLMGSGLREQRGEALGIEMTRLSNSNSGLLRVFQALAAGADTIRVSIHDRINPKIVLVGEFPAGMPCAEAAHEILTLCWLQKSPSK